MFGAAAYVILERERCRRGIAGRRHGRVAGILREHLAGPDAGEAPTGPREQRLLEVEVVGGGGIARRRRRHRDEALVARGHRDHRLRRRTDEVPAGRAADARTELVPTLGRAVPHVDAETAHQALGAEGDLADRLRLGERVEAVAGRERAAAEVREVVRARRTARPRARRPAAKGQSCRSVCRSTCRACSSGTTCGRATAPSPPRRRCRPPRRRTPASAAAAGRPRSAPTPSSAWRGSSRPSSSNGDTLVVAAQLRDPGRDHPHGRDRPAGVGHAEVDDEPEDAQQRGVVTERGHDLVEVDDGNGRPGQGAVGRTGRRHRPGGQELVELHEVVRRVGERARRDGEVGGDELRVDRGGGDVLGVVGAVGTERDRLQKTVARARRCDERGTGWELRRVRVHHRPVDAVAQEVADAGGRVGADLAARVRLVRRTAARTRSARRARSNASTTARARPA